MDMQPFLDKTKKIAVVGATSDSAKYGSKVYKDLRSAGYKVVAVNPNRDDVLGDKCYPTLSDVPGKIESVNIVTPPDVTNNIIAEALKLGIKNIWIQPGAESEVAVKAARDSGANVVTGICLMVQRRLGHKRDPFEEALEELEKYDEGTAPKSLKGLGCCGGH